jgi:hypothetical protein
MSESEVHRFLEGEASLLERWKIDRKRLSRYTAQEILELAVKGNVLVRGWGATYLLRSVPHVICVRICAPMPFREQVLMQRIGIKDKAVARSAIAGNDVAHDQTMQSCSAAIDGSPLYDRSQYCADTSARLRRAHRPTGGKCGIRERLRRAAIDDYYRASLRPRSALRSGGAAASKQPFLRRVTLTGATSDGV